MQWAEGWANEAGLESSFTEGESSMASHEMDDGDGGVKARLSAVADSLVAPPLKHRSVFVVFHCFLVCRHLRGSFAVRVTSAFSES